MNALESEQVYARDQLAVSNSLMEQHMYEMSLLQQRNRYQLAVLRDTQLTQKELHAMLDVYAEFGR